MPFPFRLLLPASCRPWGWLPVLSWLLAASQPVPAQPATGAARPTAPPASSLLADHLPTPANTTQARFFALLHQGDSVYALKRGDCTLPRIESQL